MATQLNPGADATLVQAAYAAAMANVPKDLSGTFEALATNYANTMQLVGANWSQAIKDTGELAKTATGLFAENRKAKRRGINLRNSEGVAELHNMMGDIRKDSLAVSDIGHHFSGDHMVNNPNYDSNKVMKNPNYVEGGTEPEFVIDEKDNPMKVNVGDLSKEDREKVKLNLQNRKLALEGELDTFEAVADTLGASLEQGLHDIEATNAGGENNMLKVAALAAYTSPSGKIKEGKHKGYYVLPGLNTDDELEFTLYSPDGKPIQDKNQKDVTIRSGEVNGLVVMKNEAIIAGRETLFDNIEVSAKNAVKGTTVDHHLKKSRVDHALLVENENNLHTSIWAPGYLSNESMGKDLAAIEGGGFTSANLFGTLGKTVIEGMEDQQGNKLVDMLDITGGTDETKLDAGDFANQANYDMIVNAILKRDNEYYDEDVTREIYLDWTDEMTKKAWTFGEGQRTPEKTDGFLSGYKKSGNYVINNQHHSVDIVNPTIDALNTGEDYGAELLPFTNKWEYSRRKNGKYQLLPMDGGKDDWVTFNNPQDIAKKLGIQPALITYTVGDSDDENPFGDATANQAPSDFTTAVGIDDKDVVTYLEGLKIPGLVIKNVGGRDKIKLTLGGKTEGFVVDPNLTSNQARANEIWKWLYDNYKPPIKK